MFLPGAAARACLPDGGGSPDADGPASGWAVFPGADGAELAFRVEGYEFPDTTDAQNPDSQWLVIHARLRSPGGASAEFTDPCLRLAEARALASWLFALACAPNGGLPADGSTFLGFAEPLLALGLRDVLEDEVLLGVICPDPDEEPRLPAGWPEPLECAIPRAGLLEAARLISAQLDALPPRR